MRVFLELRVDLTPRFRLAYLLQQYYVPDVCAQVGCTKLSIKERCDLAPIFDRSERSLANTDV